MNGSEVELDVAIVGGGISGLVVADSLARAGKRVRLFEARPQLGGRIKSVPVAGGHADLGPTWFWPGEHRVIALVAELGLDVYDQWTTGDALLVADGSARRLGGYAAPPAFRFSRGVQSLVDGLAERLPAGTVTLDCPVSRVEGNADRVVIHAKAEQVNAGAVVLALPPSLVIDQQLVDAADLDAETAAVAADIPVWMGAIAKAVAVYESPFWRDEGLSGMMSVPGGPFHEVHDMSGPDGSPAMLFGFGQAHPSGPPLTGEMFAAQLVSVFGAAAAEPLELHSFDWSAETFTTPSGGPNSARYELFGAPVFQRPQWDGRLFWSSTETATEAPGHIEGALCAAERVVRSLLP
ncbi:MAG: flavin monoamine oxidase family protein [Acidimicrobiales bacterium]